MDKLLARFRPNTVLRSILPIAHADAALLSSTNPTNQDNNNNTSSLVPALPNHPVSAVQVYPRHEGLESEADHSAKYACTVCSDHGERHFDGDSNSNNTQEIRCVAYMHSQCPLNRRELGRASWAYLHTLAAYYPDNPTPKQQKDMSEFVFSYAKMYPCGYCADKTRDEMIRRPPKVANRHEFQLWMCGIHNEVNDRLGKPLFDCSQVDQRWRTGWADGSCDSDSLRVDYT